VATEGVGIRELIQAINTHANYLQKSGERQERERVRLQSELDQQIQESLLARWRENLSSSDYQSVLEELAARRISPSQAAAQLTDPKPEPQSRR